MHGDGEREMGAVTPIIAEQREAKAMLDDPAYTDKRGAWLWLCDALAEECLILREKMTTERTEN